VLTSTHALVRSRRSQAAWSFRRARALLCVLGLSACGHFGIDEAPDGLVVSSGGRDSLNSGGKSDALGGTATGGDGVIVSSGGDTSSTGGEASGGDAGDGGSASGGIPSDGGTPSSGGSSDGGAPTDGGSPNGGSASGGSGGMGAGDCNLSDPVCEGLVRAMVNRYSFLGTGTQVVDSLGGEVGIIHGPPMDGSGQVTLSGAGDYVELPGTLISSLPNATFEIWFVWHGGDPWQRLFEFGDQDSGQAPVNYLFVTPKAGGSDPAINALTAGLRHLGGGERQLRTGVFTDTQVLTQVVLIADDGANRLTLYKNGEWLADLDTDVRLDGIQDGVSSLGRSLFSDDPYFDGEILDFRIYGEVLTADMITESYRLGADATFPPLN
jgi:hypothetical protein